jgi:asparagine synthase (glutamine-hydrolysing)
MCGIAGIVTSGSVRAATLEAMSMRLRHRGPDDEGYVALDQPGGSFVSFRGEETVAELGDLPHWQAIGADAYSAGMCHRRLSILDLSAAGHQPMLSASGELALVFNGEIYNYLEIRDELEEIGWHLRPCGDTAVLLAAFAEWGPACVERLRGMWAFAVLDRRSGRLTLSRDRFGIKPLYYARIGDAFVFASEIKAVLAAFGRRPRASTGAVVSLLSWGGMDADESTLFEDVHALTAGCTLEVDPVHHTVTVDRYYDLDERSLEIFDGGLGDAVDEYRRYLKDSVSLHMRSDVRVGACLSGGLDSSLLAALSTSHLDGSRLATFTAVYDDPAIDERQFVELQSRESALLETHFTAPDADMLLAEMDDFIRAQDHPVASSSPFSQWMVMRLAGATGIKVLLDGQGADEAIGGYSYFAGAHLLELIGRGRFFRAASEARRVREHRGVAVVPQLGRAAARRLPARAVRHARLHLRMGGDLVVPGFRALAGDPPRSSPRTYRDFCIDAIKRSLPQLLRYEDRSSMAFSIESRVPFLDHPLVEFVLSLPTDMKFRDGWSKYVQRCAAGGLVPDEIRWRRDKVGFATPQRAWHHATAGRISDVVARAKLPEFLDKRRIQETILGDIDRPAHQSEYWQAIFLLRWMQLFDVDFA